MTYTPRTLPREHQRRGQERVSPDHPEAFAWLMDMGTGKSWMVLWEFGELESRGLVSDLIVVAPAGSYHNWYLDQDLEECQITRHCSEELRSRLLVAAWDAGGTRAERRIMNRVVGRERGAQPRALFVNVEAFSSGGAAEEACRRLIETSLNGVMMVVDESTRIKRRNARRTKAVLRLGEICRYRRICTGLLAPRSPMDIFSQFQFLDWRILGHRSFFSFRARHAVLKKIIHGGRRVTLEVGYRDVETIRRKIAPHSFRVLKDECLDLLPKRYSVREVEMTSEQRRIYRDILEFATAELQSSDHVTATTVISQIMRLRQILCGHTVDENGVEHDIPENRTSALIELLEEQRGKAVVWLPYQRTIQKVARALSASFGEDSVALFYGGNRATRSEDENRWKHDPKCRWLLASEESGGVGNTWVAGNLSVYYANNYDLELRLQSEDRMHRDGQTGKVDYVDLMTRGTVDEKIVQALRRKLNLTTTITGENYREWLI